MPRVRWLKFVFTKLVKNMQLSVNDYVGFIGVFILLIAFLFNLIGKMDKDGLPYILLNVLGAGLSCFASYLIHYLPFVILEGTWSLVSIAALIKYFSNSGKKAN